MALTLNLRKVLVLIITNNQEMENTFCNKGSISVGTFSKTEY